MATIVKTLMLIVTFDVFAWLMTVVAFSTTMIFRLEMPRRLQTCFPTTTASHSTWGEEDSCNESKWCWNYRFDESLACA
uniref:Secreted protein n=1 Tax=Ascaris lumbricoides TaxID=6252 RepID=A0A0M3I1K4_ASCLU